MKRFVVWAGSLCALVLFLLGCDASENTKKAEYELQERCGKKASEYLDRSANIVHEAGIMRSQANHYNKKLNKCFVLVSSRFTNEGGAIHDDVVLFDIVENKVYGNFNQTNGKVDDGRCVLEAKRCNSIAEWNDLVKPFMED